MYLSSGVKEAILIIPSVIAGSADATEPAQTETVKASYGFAGTNAGTINRGMANVDIAGGFAFVGENTGLVTTSYGWFGDGSKENYDTKLKMTGTGTCLNSYFADLDPVKKSDESAVVYDEKGVADEVTSSALQNAQIKDFTTGYKAHPYLAELAAETYPFPMLRDHYGDWITPPQFAYGVAYYEKYSDGTYKIHLVELSDATKTEENVSVSQTAAFNADGSFIGTTTLDEKGTIDQTGYAMFYNVQSKNDEDKILEIKVGEHSHSPVHRKESAD